MNDNIKFIDNAIYDSENHIVNDTNNNGVFLPLGSIIPVSSTSPSFPDSNTFESYINTDFWRKCNGGTEDIIKSDGSVLVNVSVPDLTSDIFLMGGTGTSGGATDDGSTNDGHHHTTMAAVVESDDYTDAGLDSHTHPNETATSSTRQKASDGVLNRAGVNSQTTHTSGNPSSITHDHGSVSSNFGTSTIVGDLSVNGDPDAGGDGSNRPLYFTVFYYMRIK